MSKHAQQVQGVENSKQETLAIKESIKYIKELSNEKAGQ